MEAVTYVLDDRAWTRQERDALPDDGCRHEIVDGALVVTPAPSPAHQRLVGGLYRALFAACPPGLEVFVAPFDVVLDQGTVMQPDVVVVDRSALDERGTSQVPLLAVEVTSQSTRMVDANLKFARFERGGCPSMWLADPTGPSVTAFELRAGCYVEVARVEGGGRWEAELPFRVSICPSDLVRRPGE